MGYDEDWDKNHDRKNEYFCNICGMLITNREIGAEFNGECIDYIEKNIDGAHFYICNECYDIIMAIKKGGVKRAKELHKERIENDKYNTKMMKKNKKGKNKRNKMENN